MTQADVLAHEPEVELYWEEDRCGAGRPRTTPATFTYHEDMRPRACLVAEENPAPFF